jgi:hypothetical protein
MNTLEELIRRLVPAACRPRIFLGNLVVKHTGSRVMGGPFAGMKYVRKACCSMLSPKLVGLYERALQPVVEEIVAGDFDRIVDVGSAEGYYAVGLALRCPRAAVIGFDLDSEARSLLQEMAEINGVENRVEVRARCGPAELQQVLAGVPRPLLVCDCEGYEEELLDLDLVPALRKTAVLVELHEVFSRGISERLRRRFEASHEVREIWEEEYRDSFPFPSLYARLVPQKYVSMALDEKRPERMNWFWMKPKVAG